MRSTLLTAMLLAAGRAPKTPPPEPVPVPDAPLPVQIARLPLDIEAVSFLGDTLRAIPLGYDTHVAHEAQLAGAIMAARANPDGIPNARGYQRVPRVQRLVPPRPGARPEG